MLGGITGPFVLVPVLQKLLTSVFPIRYTETAVKWKLLDGFQSKIDDHIRGINVLMLFQFDLTPFGDSGLLTIHMIFRR